MTGEAADDKPSPVLDPVERVSEVVFGVLMALTFTGSVSVAGQGQDVRTMLFAAFGCNLAWGLTDAVMYLVGVLTERYRGVRLLRQLQATPDRDAAHRMIADALPDRIAPGTSPELLESMRKHLLTVRADDAKLRREDYSGALGVFVLVVLATLPVALPFVIFDNVGFALRASNAMAVLTLFVGGTILGKYAGASPWRYGLAMTAVGLVLVAAIIALGG